MALISLVMSSSQHSEMTSASIPGISATTGDIPAAMNIACAVSSAELLPAAELTTAGKAASALLLKAKDGDDEEAMVKTRLEAVNLDKGWSFHLVVD